MSYKLVTSYFKDFHNYYYCNSQEKEADNSEEQDVGDKQDVDGQKVCEKPGVDNKSSNNPNKQENKHEHLSQKIFKKILLDNPRVLAIFVKFCRLKKDHVRRVEEMILPPKVLI